jgi:hypothetical protein
MVLGILDFEASEGTAIFSEGNLASEVDAKRLNTLKVDLLTSSDIDVFCRCIAGERVAVESGNPVSSSRTASSSDGVYVLPFG